MTHPTQQAVAINPAVGKERYEFLDVLRGIALFGIITANMILYSLYDDLPVSAQAAMSTHASDRVLDFLELTFIEGKFYTIFSVLFGVGFSILLTRTQARTSSFHRFFLRRMLFLFLIGFAHAALFWHDDILESYALCGALLLPFVKARNRTIIWFSVLALATGAVIKFTNAIPYDSLAWPKHLLLARFGLAHASELETLAHGRLQAILGMNFAHILGQYDFLISSGMIFKIFGCFLLGFYLGRNEIYKRLDEFRPLIKRLAIWGLVIGIPLNILYAYTFSNDDSWVRNLTEALGILPLSAAYASLICLLWLSPRWRRSLQVFAPVGRTALSNYVGQSVICTLIFYGTGLGLGGTMGPTLYLPIAWAVYLFQIWFSRLWLSRFQFGPLEWIWRSLTYGKRVPMLKPRSV